MKTIRNNISIPQWIIIILISSLVLGMIYPVYRFDQALNDGSSIAKQGLWLRYAGFLLTPLSILVLTYSLFEQLKQNKTQFEELKYAKNVQAQELSATVSNRLLKSIWLETPMQKRESEFSAEKVLNQVFAEFEQSLSSSKDFTEMLSRFSAMNKNLAISKKMYIRHLGITLEEAMAMNENPSGYNAISRFVADHNDTAIMLSTISLIERKHREELPNLSINKNDSAVLKLIASNCGIYSYWGHVPNGVFVN